MNNLNVELVVEMIQQNQAGGADLK